MFPSQTRIAPMGLATSEQFTKKPPQVKIAVLRRKLHIKEDIPSRSFKTVAQIVRRSLACIFSRIGMLPGQSRQILEDGCCVPLKTIRNSSFLLFSQSRQVWPVAKIVFASRFWAPSISKASVLSAYKSPAIIRFSLKCRAPHRALFFLPVRGQQFWQNDARSWTYENR